MCIYVYVSSNSKRHEIAEIPNCRTSVCEENTLEKSTLRNISFQRTNWGAGLQFLPLDCMAKARVRGFALFVHRHRHHRFLTILTVSTLRHQSLHCRVPACGSSKRTRGRQARQWFCMIYYMIWCIWNVITLHRQSIILLLLDIILLFILHRQSIILLLYLQFKLLLFY